MFVPIHHLPVRLHAAKRQQKSPAAIAVGIAVAIVAGVAGPLSEASRSSGTWSAATPIVVALALAAVAVGFLVGRLIGRQGKI